MQTEIIDKLFLGLSQFTNATTKKELILDNNLQYAINLLSKVVKNGYCEKEMCLKIANFINRIKRSKP